MTSQHVRPVGDIEDHDGMTVIVGVDYDTVTIHRGIFQPGGGIRFTAARLEEFLRLLAEARRQAGDDDEAGPVTGVPMVCTACRKPVVRRGGVWTHTTLDAASACGLAHGEVGAMAAGNENVR